MNAQGLAPLRRPELATLWAAVRQRLESNGVVISASPVRLGQLSAAERDAVAGLLGRARAHAGAVAVRLDVLDRVLRASAVSAGLVEVVEALSGPLRDRRSERDSQRAARESLWSNALEHPALRRAPRVGEWLAAARRSGVVTRAALGEDPARVLGQALDALDRLPADGLHLARLAAETTGDSHALDRSRPLGSVVLHALCFVADQPTPTSASAWRRVWADAGVVCDDLSCDVLVLNLPLRGGGLTARVLRDHASVGEPVRLTLRQLVGESLAVAAESPVFVCENPIVVAYAADTLASRSAPLICVDGVPNTAARRLLEQLAAGGASLHYHGDFDWGGVRIANIVIGALGATPWRFTAEQYRAARATMSTTGVPLGDRPVRATWDPDLTAAMLDGGTAIFEEQLLDHLAADLSSTSAHLDISDAEPGADHARDQ